MREAMMPVYAPPPVVFSYGKGAYLFTEENKRYLDFTAGIAVSSLGHAHPELVNALKNQGEKLWHLSNMFRAPSAEDLASKLCNRTFADMAFFSNSGAEANECGLKIIRRYHFDKGSKRHRIIGMTGSFHGRTMATIAAAKNESYTKGFIFGDHGYDQVPFGDIDALKSAITDETAGIVLEPIQGEGGIKVADKAYLKAVRELCDTHGLLLMFDEVQCGLGRTGYFYAYEALGVTPDILTSAKGIGGGFPIGVCIATKAAAECMVIGTHGSTFGGNPLATTVASKVVDIVGEASFLKHVQDIGDYLTESLEQLVKKYPNVYQEVTGMGLMQGLKVIPENTKLLVKLRDEHNVLVVKAGGNSLRFLPPLIIGKEEVDLLVKALDSVGENS